MNGDFKPDITRDTFGRHKHFSRVLMQQGRVQLDSDWNEHTDIFLHYMRTLATDLIGPHAGPVDQDGQVPGFKIVPYQPKATTTKKKTADAADTAYKIAVQEGRYYIDGILVENDAEEFVFTVEEEEQQATKDGKFLFYLDMWEREVTYLEDDLIRESALGGPDTATRSQVVWQVRGKAITGTKIPTPRNVDELEKFRSKPDDFKKFVTELTALLREQAPSFQGPVGHSSLKARTLPSEEEDYTDPCITPPSSQYRGAENQLYRVEIHDDGTASPEPNQGRTPRQKEGEGKQDIVGQQGTATFKWSRENGSVVFPIIGPVSGGDTMTLTLERLGRDDSRFALQMGDWVEIIDIEDELERQPGMEVGQILQVASVDYINMQVTLKGYQGYSATFDQDSDATKPRLLRRWDYKEVDSDQKGAITLAKDGAIQVIENKWLTLEDGIQVLFHRDVDQQSDQDADDLPPYYRSGDYWLIPARIGKGEIEWPHRKHERESLPPHGVVHHYAPLAYVTFGENGSSPTASNIIDLRRKINQVWEQLL